NVGERRHPAGSDHGAGRALTHPMKQFEVGALEHAIPVDIGDHIASASLSVQTFEGLPEVTALLRPSARCQRASANIKPDGDPVAILGNGRGGPLRILQRCGTEVDPATAV